MKAQFIRVLFRAIKCSDVTRSAIKKNIVSRDLPPPAQNSSLRPNGTDRRGNQKKKPPFSNTISSLIQKKGEPVQLISLQRVPLLHCMLAHVVIASVTKSISVGVEELGQERGGCESHFLDSHVISFPSKELYR